LRKYSAIATSTKVVNDRRSAAAAIVQSSIRSLHGASITVFTARFTCSNLVTACPGAKFLRERQLDQFLLCADISDILGLKRSDDAALAFLIVGIAAVELLALIL
jgi:hypothetical protein